MSTSSVFSERDTTILQMIADGHTNAEIASRVQVGPQYLQDHYLSNLYGRLGIAIERGHAIQTRCRAVAEAFRRGMIQ